MNSIKKKAAAVLSAALCSLGIILPSAAAVRGDLNGDSKVNAYDAIREDLENSIMPFMEENYPIKTGRENTAVTGFSMGGREALYVGVTRPQLYGYVGSVCAAPGIFPTTDGNMTHEGCMSPSEFGFGSGPSPYVLMLTCTRFDGTVGDAPESYHNALTANGAEHIWHQLTDGDHGGISVRAHMYNFLRYIFKAV